MPGLPIREHEKIAVDISSQSEKWIAKNKHVTKGKFDKSSQIKSVLSNPKTCNDLKKTRDKLIAGGCSLYLSGTFRYNS